MKPAPFAYVKPNTLSEAVDLLAAEEGGHVLAGGQSLLPLLAMRVIRPTLLVDVLRLPELTAITWTRDGLRVAAATPQRALERDPLARERLPVLTAALEHVGHVQSRSRGTVGGSVAHLDPTAELPALAILMGATVEVVGPQGRRTIEIDDFALGPFGPNLDQGDVVTAVTWPRPASGTRWSFRELARRRGDLAIALSAGLLGDGWARVVVGATGDVPRRLPELEAQLADGQIHRGQEREASTAALARLEITGNPLDGDAGHARALADATLARVLADLLASPGDLAARGHTGKIQ